MSNVKAKYNATPPTLASDQWGDLQLDSSGNLKTNASNKGYSSSVSITRPNNTNVYAANDVVGALVAAVEFTSVGPSGGVIEIVSSTFEIDLDAVPAGMTGFTLHLYGVTPPSALADEATWDLPAGDRASYLGSIALGTPADVGSTLYIQANSLAKQLKLTGTSLFGYLVTVGTYTAAANTVHKIVLNTKSL